MRTATLLTEARAPTGMATHHQPMPQQRSPWHSPVPYLFGGLAAMLGLIAFALLLLACSYWKLSGYLEGGNNDDVESGDGKPGDAGASKPLAQPLEQRIVVIMAGDDKPTFLATPMSSGASSFGDNTIKGNGRDVCNKTEDEKKSETQTGADAESQRQEVTHENREMETQRNQNQPQTLEETNQSLDRDQ